MNIQKIGKKHGVEVDGEAVDLGFFKGIECDLIVASMEISQEIKEENIEVIGIDNILDQNEIENKIVPYLIKLKDK
ncbi:PTS sugar transporter subunit IIB [Clostridium sp. Marseille-Q2269]|uniref:PTS sugar transporter subunit IIB n=1 Tax=Clostridium sp. Marseille-Q2269 TaxID=2942205 RepID=UPI00207489FE|nr:PTS sugar transporter subunit IIB [Clostridium sp. Marseille-Q2269]